MINNYKEILRKTDLDVLLSLGWFFITRIVFWIAVFSPAILFSWGTLFVEGGLHSIPEDLQPIATIGLLQALGLGVFLVGRLGVFLHKKFNEMENWSNEKVKNWKQEIKD